MDNAQLKEVIAGAVQNGRFGEKLTFVDFVPSIKEGEDQFASDVVFGKVVSLKGDEKHVVSVVVKKQQGNAFLREMMCCDIQFYNEDLVYKDILIFVNKNSIVENVFPKVFYSHSTLGKAFEEDVLVIEDLQPLGYKLSNEKIFLDFEHVSLVLEKLGKFHALSYASKKEKPAEFSKLAKQLKEPTWLEHAKDDFYRMTTLAMERGILHLLESGEHVSALNKLKEKAQNPYELGLDLIRPEEPLAVICHGDFNRNNMLFKYDDAGKPVDVKFFDLATARYASPAIDLSFFLFMNTTAALRTSHWEDLFKIYHGALAAAVPGTGVPSLEELRHEVEKKAVYGYILCSFFIPMMMDPFPKNELDDFGSLSTEALDEMAMNKGGEPATKVISDIVRDVVRLQRI